ncbi:MAG: CoA transferase [Syntrophaceae bacterium]|nr:CoA transferase [Syntrophaceae bacterium]
MTGPLSGLRILDFTTMIPGPLATLYLADMGAEVLKIVSRSRPDINTQFPPFLPGNEISANGAYLGRNKRSMYLNIKDKRARQIVHKLIMHYDILIEQFRPGVMAKAGLDYETLRLVNPALIYCSITSYGQTGPLAARAGHDINYMARSGIMSYSGRKDGGPVPSGAFIGDTFGSVNALIGILAAEIGRTKTGQGEYIDISMIDSLVALNYRAAASLIDGKNPDYESTIFNGGSIYDYYEAKDGKYMSVGPLESKFSAVLFEAIGRPDLITPQGIMPANIKDVKEQIRNVFKTKTRDEWLEIFSSVDACVEPVLTVHEALNNEQSEEREMVIDIDLPDGGKVRQPALPIKFSNYKPEYKKIGVPDGFNTKEVLQELGYSEDQITEMENTGLFD